MQTRVREVRIRQGLSQEELSEKSGVSAANISRIETGETKNPRPSTMRRLASALGVSVYALWIEEDKKTDDPSQG